MNFDENSRIMTKVFDKLMSSVWLLSFLHKMNCVNIFRLKILPTSSNSHIDILNCNFYHSILFRRRILRQTYFCRCVRFGYSISMSKWNQSRLIRCFTGVCGFALFRLSPLCKFHSTAATLNPMCKSSYQRISNMSAAFSILKFPYEFW